MTQLVVSDLKEFRKDLRAIDKSVLKELREVLKSGAELAAPVASTLAPKGGPRSLTKERPKLSKSIRPGVSGTKSFIRSSAAHVGPHEFGGTISPKGTPITIRRKEFMQQGVERVGDRVLDKVGDGLEALADRHGFR